jgi:hypothetical protein
VEPFLTLDDPGVDRIVRAEALAELATVHTLAEILSERERNSTRR